LRIFLKMNKKKQYFDILFNEWNKIIKKKNFLSEETPCPVCGKSKQKLIFTKKKLSFVNCLKCHHFFINPYIKDNLIQKHFENDYSWKIWSEKILFSNQQKKIENKKYILGIKILNKIFKNKNLEILDVGSSAGNFLKICKNKKWNITGIEPSKKSVYFAKKKNNITLINTNFENYNSDKKFDLITFWASFEYLTEFQKNLKKIKKFLKKKGKLLIYISGNSNSLIMRILQKNCLGFLFNRRNYFNPFSLNYLLKKYKFKNLAKVSDSNSLQAVNNYLSYKNPYEKNKDKKLLFDINIFLKKRIIKNLMGYKFLSIYEKK